MRHVQHFAWRVQDGITPLMAAAGNGNADTIKLLLERGAALEAQDKDGMTSLMWAASKGEVSTAALLLDSGADKEACNTVRGRL